MKRPLVAVALLAACARIAPDSRAFPCAADADCLEGWVCAERVCAPAGTALPRPDAGADAGSGEAPDAGVLEEPDAGTSELPDPCGLIAGGSTVARAESNGWTLQLGGAADEVATAIVREPSGAVLVAGTSRDPANDGSRGFLLKLTPQGAYDSCVPTAPSDSSARVAWNAAALDYVSGDVFLAGETNAALASGSSESGTDVVVARFAADGTRQWLRQFDFSPAGRLANDTAAAITTTGDGHLLVVGRTTGRAAGEAAGTDNGSESALFLSISTQGDLLEAHTVSDPGGSASAAAAGSGASETQAVLWSQHSLKGSLGLTGEGYLTLATVPVAGRPSLGSEVAFASASAEPSTGPTALTLLPDDLVIAGGITSSLLGLAALGHEDGFVLRFAPDGKVVWKARFGSSAVDVANGVAACGTDVCAAGTTFGTVSGAEANLGGSDAFVVRLRGSDGNVLAASRFGTGGADVVRAAIGDGAGGMLVVGRTEGDLGRRQRGAGDLFVRRLVP